MFLCLVVMPLRVFLCYDGERHEYFIPDGSKVGDIRAEVKYKFMLGQDDGKAAKKVCDMTCAVNINYFVNAILTVKYPELQLLVRFNQKTQNLIIQYYSAGRKLVFASTENLLN